MGRRGHGTPIGSRFWNHQPPPCAPMPPYPQQERVVLGPWRHWPGQSQRTDRCGRDPQQRALGRTFPQPVSLSLVGPGGPGPGPRKGRGFLIPFCLHTWPLVCGSQYIYQPCWVSLLPPERGENPEVSDPQRGTGQEKAEGLTRVFQIHRALLRERLWERQVGS